MYWICDIIIHMLSKICSTCGKEFFKDKNRSIKDFNERAKFCSNACKVYGQENFYKFWKDKKRPDLVNTNSSRTMFKKGDTPWIKGKKAPWSRKHGLSNTNIYRRWLAMNQRCNNPNHKQYKDYGARGIMVEWKSFDDFKVDMYAGYKKHTQKHGLKNTRIERIDNNGNYSKENCIWATCKVQMRNTRRNHLITFNGKTKCMTDWANDLGITYTALWKRLKKYPLEKAFLLNNKYEV